MGVRLLLAVQDTSVHLLLRNVVTATRPLLPFDLDIQVEITDSALCKRVAACNTDMILLDWSLAATDTPKLVEELVCLDANLRVVVLLPQAQMQYRMSVWMAGAWASISQESLDSEWLANILCLVKRSMERETKLRHTVEQFSRDRSQQLRRMIEIQEECRRRVARDLHDEVSQSLTTALVQLDTVEALLHRQPEQVSLQVNRIRTTLGRLHEEVQRVLLDLRPILLEQKGLMAALAWYGNERLRPLGCAVHLSGGNCAPDLPEEVQLTLYRIGQELLSNVARHAAAQNVWLDLRCTGTELRLVVRDDGRGFDAAAMQHDALRGVGLLGVHERAWLLNGTVTFTSTPGNGATVEVQIPYAGACCTP